MACIDSIKNGKKSAEWHRNARRRRRWETKTEKERPNSMLAVDWIVCAKKIMKNIYSSERCVIDTTCMRPRYRVLFRSHLMRCLIDHARCPRTSDVCNRYFAIFCSQLFCNRFIYDSIVFRPLIGDFFISEARSRSRNSFQSDCDLQLFWIRILFSFSFLRRWKVHFGIGSFEGGWPWRMGIGAAENVLAASSALVQQQFGESQ